MAKFWVCGSVAFDTIFDYGMSFSEHFIEGQLDNINTSFYVPEMKKAFGGCAGNICYSAAMLGMTPSIVASVGSLDIDDYAEHFKSIGVDTEYLVAIKNTYTAQAYLIQDKNGNQISAFYPGAMENSGEIELEHADEVALAIIGPDSLDGILKHAKDCSALGVPIIFDPGQSIPIIDAKNMRFLIDKATWLVVNNYEYQAILQKTGLSPEALREQLDALIVTNGGEGTKIYTDQATYLIPTIDVTVVDTVGAGDAYRAGLIYGLLNNHDWLLTGKIASLCGAYKVEVSGPQNYSYSPSEFMARFKKEFGEELVL